MLLIHKPRNHKLLILVITSICSIGVLLSLSVLTYTPELSHAESITHKKTIEDITYMQEMTPGICQNMESEKQYQLVDKRDDKTYWIAKLKDGNCWMTQNLAYDDGASSFSMPSSWGNDNAARKYYNPGLYVYTTPATQNNCGTSSINSLDTCTSKGWVNVAGWTPSDDPNYAGIADTTNKIYNAHYLAGNYYSWIAATNGSGAGIETNGTNANDSICPTGWQLPTSSTGGQFATLTSGLTASTTVTTNNLRLPPYYFVYGGSVIDGYLTNAGSSGYYWSSTVAKAPGAYGLTFSTIVNPSYNHSRYAGFSVRCVTRGESIPNNNVEITVNSTISLDVVNEVSVEKSETNPSTANLDVKVSSNQKYSVGISASNPNLISTTSNVTIPAKSGLLNTAENGWGIKLKDNINYTALTTSLQTFYTASGAEIKTVPFTIGISTAPDLPNGEYSTNITITATQN